MANSLVTVRDLHKVVVEAPQTLKDGDKVKVQQS
jgi:hypothetical protein